jgi:hypothetical protein
VGAVLGAGGHARAAEALLGAAIGLRTRDTLISLARLARPTGDRCPPGGAGQRSEASGSRMDGVSGARR